MSNPVFIEVDVAAGDTGRVVSNLVNLASLDTIHPASHKGVEGTALLDLKGDRVFSHTPYETIRDRIALATQPGPRYVVDGKVV